MSFTITPTELKSRLDNGDKLVLVDVREPMGIRDLNWRFRFSPLGNPSAIAWQIRSECRNHRRVPSRNAKRGCDGIPAAAGFRKCKNRSEEWTPGRPRSIRRSRVIRPARYPSPSRKIDGSP